ncbi:MULTISPECIES: S49 family peptidase [unclassified Chelatococcus]|uniref:S49 family peptidase n=1 Tax=unclassified Chelatococcus TaxID=2638111 RepID=UPI001BCD34D1|nr:MULTISPECIES: S49 family peptidase [unclassified Chelatococcus]CAH1670702.1 Peptidase S49 [Hyphomicrobiales bacterium]MBS7738370.1 S49 family peptidase [Chelatococcus sp. HY11]MBX3545898.1 S49 family peptidase [Chelatococcus sp.]MCO5077284.1 S49 family peptidase [Chelatococcus sp.]CAH1677065.1 Peptidase S49 [Hyphomicrobiales bacterium]
MKYAHIIMAVAGEVWAIDGIKMQEIVAFLAAQASGEKFSAEEVEARIGKSQERDLARREGSVAVLPLRGVIANRMSLMGDISGGASNEALSRQFQALVADDTVKAIVLDVDSPGGAVAGTDELSAQIFSARGIKPVVAHVNATAASAAYWIATAADEVVVTPSGAVGSIGVFGVHDDISAALEKMGVRKTIVSAGRYKTEGNPFSPLEGAALEAMQARVDESYEAFVAAVARNRGASVKRVREGFGQGRMVSAQEAVAQGMADRVATLEETLRRFGASQFTPPPSAAAPRRRSFAFEREKRALDLI